MLKKEQQERRKEKRHRGRDRMRKTPSDFRFLRM